jgi:hypothetical protein
MHTNSHSDNEQKGGYKIPAVLDTQPLIQHQVQVVKKIPQPVVEKKNNNPKKIPQLPPIPLDQQTGQIQQLIADKNKSRSRSRSRSTNRSSNRSSNRSNNKDGKSKKSKSRSTRKPKYQNEHRQFIAKLYSKNNINQKTLFKLLEQLQ